MSARDRPAEGIPGEGVLPPQTSPHVPDEVAILFNTCLVTTSDN